MGTALAGAAAPGEGRGRGVPAGTVLPVLFLVADTGAGHRSAANAVAEELLRSRPGGLAPVLLDPLGGPSARWALRRVMRLYGPAIRWAPWLWGLAYRASDSRVVLALVRRMLLRLADGPVEELVSALAPVAVVSFHPLAAGAAATAARRSPGRPPVVTVITDLLTAHVSWWSGDPDRFVVASAEVAGQARRRRGAAPVRCLDLGLPVARQFRGGAPLPAERDALRRSLGLPTGRFVLVVTGGGEGAGGMYRTVSALISGFDDIDVVAICGRNGRLRRRLTRLAGHAGGRLRVLGFVTNMADWLRCADALATKAGPGAIAEAACCGAAMLLTGHVPGQERGNAEFVVTSGAGLHARRTGDLLREAARLRDDRDALERMRAASARLGRPGAAAAIADLLTGLSAGAVSAVPRASAVSPPSVVPPAAEVEQLAAVSS